MKKQIISFNELEYNRVISSASEACVQMNEILEDYQKLGISPTNESWEMIKNREWDSLRQYVYNEVKAVTASKLPDVAQLVESVAEGSVNVLNRYILGSWANTTTGQGNYMAYLSFEGGKVIISKETEKRIRDGFTISVETAKGNEYFELHKQTAANLQSLVELLKIKPYQLIYYVNQIFDITGDTIVTRPIKYDMLNTAEG